MFFLPDFFSIKNHVNIFWYKTVCFLYVIPYSVYELIQIKKNDLINNTNVFYKRILLMLVASIILILSSLILNRIYSI